MTINWHKDNIIRKPMVFFNHIRDANFTYPGRNNQKRSIRIVLVPIKHILDICNCIAKLS